KKGQLLIQVRDDDFQARANRAESLYHKALASITAIKKQLEVQDVRIEDAKYLMSAGKQDVSQFVASSDSVAASVQAARSALQEAKEQKRQAQERLRADKAIALRANLEKTRQSGLFDEDASTKQTVEQVVADNDRAAAVVAGDEADIARLDRMIEQRSFEINREKEAHSAADASAERSRFTYRSRGAEYTGEVKQKNVLEAELLQAQADAESLKASWNEALVELDYTKIVAPVDGVLSERRVRAGQQVNAGTQVVTIVSAVPWVIANYRETQMHHIQKGDRAEVSVDALGGDKIKGTVQSLSPASEAQFALLPPDNPSGNFTKITQRLPVKITFSPQEKNVDRIKPGMTVIVKVWTK
ncbi:MAG TPA: efflux RND transporter periplasmic adaptor subunit, partial [Trichormus sp.]